MTTFKDLIRDFGLEITKKAVDEEGISREEIEEKLDELMDQLKERIDG